MLPSYRTPGGHRRIRRDDLLAFLRKHQIPTPESLIEGTFSVLVVDDESEIVDMVKSFLLRQGGYEVATASDGISALLEVGRVKPDLLILDIMIPGVDGMEVCRRIKADTTNKTIIIAVSGSADTKTISSAPAPMSSWRNPSTWKSSTSKPNDSSASCKPLFECDILVGFDARP